ncbi:MAG TPA: NAD(P)-dependent oxidoreductase [Gaiellaceae bacterium]|nr:NAD(P)-dependent oxidoreductase [Gaiellaceae bacterium]
MRIVLTGAAGLIGRALREPLREQADLVRLVDRETVEPVGRGEEALTADLTDFEAARHALEGADAVVHLAGIPSEDAFERLLDANIRATYNVFEAARLCGLRRVVLASSNHATGFYRRDERVAPADRPRPDSLYGVTKVFGEALGSLYADKFGLAVVAVRIGAFAAEPPDGPTRPMWISPGDTFRLVWAALTAREVRFEIVYGVSATGQTWWANDAAARRIGYAPVDALELGEECHGGAPQGGEFARPEYHGLATG